MHGSTRPQTDPRERSSLAPSLTLALILVMGAARPAAGAELTHPDESQLSAPVVTAVVGRVEVRAQDGAAWEALAAGTALRPGDVIRTGSRAKAEVTHPAGVIRMFEHTILRLPVEVSDTLHVVRRPELLVGWALFDVMPERLGGLIARVGVGLQSLFEVATPHIVSGVKGTRFAVIEQGSRSVVVVYSGVVSTTNETGSPRDSAVLTVGKMATYDNGRLTGVSSVRLQDDWAAWTRPAVRTPRAAEGATGRSAPTRESRLDGAAAEADPAALASDAATLTAVISTPTTDTGGSPGTGPTTGGGTTLPSTGGTTDPGSGGGTGGGPTTTTPTATTLPSMTTPSVTLPNPVSVNPSSGKVQ
jgi:FecR protein